MALQSHLLAEILEEMLSSIMEVNCRKIHTMPTFVRHFLTVSQFSSPKMEYYHTGNGDLFYIPLMILFHHLKR